MFRFCFLQRVFKGCAKAGCIGGHREFRQQALAEVQVRRLKQGAVIKDKLKASWVLAALSLCEE